MTMTYAQLVTNVSDTVENEFTTAQIDMFIDLAEQTIYNTVQIPALRKNVTGNISASDRYLTMPTDFLYPLSLAVVTAAGDYVYLLNKDVSFLLSAYPNPTTEGTPAHYAIFSETAFILGPTPDAGLVTELHYGYYPESIVTAGTTWLGNEFDSALFNGTLVEAARFLKLEADTVAQYENMYTQAITLLRNLGAGKLKQDVYRSGETRIGVN